MGYSIRLLDLLVRITRALGLCATPAPCPVRHNLTSDVRARSAHAKHAPFDCWPVGRAGVCVLTMRPGTSVSRLVRRIRRQRHLLLPFTADENELGFSWRRGAGEFPSEPIRGPVGRKGEMPLRIASLHFEPSTLPGPATDQLKLPSRAPDSRHRQWG
jgi:hypothetical protein